MIALLPQNNINMATKGIVGKFLHVASVLIHGEPKPVIANICYLSPSEKLKGRKIIVTGGGRGLGFAMAKRFIVEGADVLIAGRNEEVLKNSANSIGCKYLKLDVQQIDGFREFINKADSMLDGVNCLVNNAGISLHENSILEVSQEQFDSQINTNFRGPYFLAKAFMEKCNLHSEKGIKNILFISSETSMTVDERPYGLTKAAVNSLVEGLAHKYVKQGYRINALAPGVTLSDMVGKKDGSNLAGGGITGRYYLPEEVAEVATFLLSDVSNILNGQIIVCNEGNTINARWK